MVSLHGEGTSLHPVAAARWTQEIAEDLCATPGSLLVKMIIEAETVTWKATQASSSADSPS